MIEVYKFGGASIQSAERIQHVSNMVKERSANQLVIIVSAAGKMTNAFEKLLDENTSDFKQLNDILKYHQLIINDLKKLNSSFNFSLDTLFSDLKQVIQSTIHDPYNKRYDQIVSFGELISTAIVTEFMRSENIDITQVDARSLIHTDNTYREGKVHWVSTADKINQTIQFTPTHSIYLTQGFIASNDEQFTTTLGREGSDFSAAVLAYCLNASKVTIWKDVDGVLNADPRLFQKTELIEHLSYKEAIEMSYYGAQVIHPKTIKPLQNKGIPLHVRSFVRPKQKGTRVDNESPASIPPIKVIKHDQCLWQISTRDFAFIVEDHLSMIYKLFATHHVKINVIQNTAISLSICLDNDPQKNIPLFSELAKDLDITEINDLELLTIRHYTHELIDQLVKKHDVVLEERIRKTCRLVVKGKVKSS